MRPSDSFIFQNLPTTQASLCNSILKCYCIYAHFETASNGVRVIEPVPDLQFTLAFFDSATQRHLAQLKYRIWKSDSDFIDLSMNIGNYCNNCPQIVALCLHVFRPRYLQITENRIFGASRLIIDLFNHKPMIDTLILWYSYRTVPDIPGHLSSVTVTHRYMENNHDANRFSKKAVRPARQHLFFYETSRTNIIGTRQMKLFFGIYFDVSFVISLCLHV
jgi:hypothetical protein